MVRVKIGGHENKLNHHRGGDLLGDLADLADGARDTRVVVVLVTLLPCLLWRWDRRVRLSLLREPGWGC